MPLKFPKRLSITQQYFVFCLLISVVPLIVLSLLFLRSSNEKLADRMDSQLKLGELLSRNAYRNDMEDLQIGTEQAALFSVAREYRTFLGGNNETPLLQHLQRYKNIKQLDFVAIYRLPDRSTVKISNFEPVYRDSFNKLLRRAFNGEVVTSIEALRDDHTGQLTLGYVSLAPIAKEERGQGISGVFVTGRSLAGEYSFQNLLELLPSLEARIIMQEPEGDMKMLSASDPVLKDSIPLKALTDWPRHARERDGVRAILEERIAGKSFRSEVSPIKDYTGHYLGYLIVSTSEDDFNELRHHNLMYIGLLAILLIVLVLWAETFFEKIFIRPLEKLATVSNQIARGDLSVRVENGGSQPEINHLVGRFNHMIQQLEETERLRSIFVSTLTHDLRTPVTAQKRVLETLIEMKDELQPEVASITSGLLQNNEQLLEMINKLLEASQYETGSIRLHQERFELSELVGSALEELYPLAEPRGIELVNHIPALNITADASQLRRVFINLIGNAIENIGYHKRVEVSSVVNNGTVTIIVQDNGPGIPSEVLPHLFKRYYMGHKTRQKIGSGLGLFICRMIVELHHGTIRVDSTVGEGSRFIMTLPREGNPHA